VTKLGTTDTAAFGALMCPLVLAISVRIDRR
jgi:hypothetical protein